MSGKGNKRRQRRINTHEEETEKKTEDTIEISDDNKSTISTDTEKTEKDTSLKDISLKDTSLKDTSLKDTSLKDTPEKPDEKKENGDQPPIETLENIQPPEPVTNPSPIKETNGQPEENGTRSSSTTPESQIPPDEIMEPLVLDSEDPELQFPSETGSETSEIEKSPILNRCKTRRSQTRNLPTPRTPKSLDVEFNGEDKPNDEKNTKELRVNITRLQPTPETEENEIEICENISVNDNISIDSSFSEKTQDTDLTNASIFANFGDTTRNVDITTTTIDDTNLSNFIDLTKDKTYGETLRCLTGRKTLRSKFSYPPRFYNSNLELNSKDYTDSSKTYSPVKTSGVKRKLESDSPGEQKKPRTEDSPGLFAYIASPFKKIGRPGIPSSTPKLTSFKFVHQGSNAIDEVEKVGVELGEDKKIEPKKWCSIM